MRTLAISNGNSFLHEFSEGDGWVQHGTGVFEGGFHGVVENGVGHGEFPCAVAATEGEEGETQGEAEFLEVSAFYRAFFNFVHKVSHF